MKKYLLPVVIAAVVISFSACKKSTDVFQTASLSDYYPLVPGKYITYNLDSLVYTNFGTVATIHSYQVKYVTDSLLTDNLGRPGYRIFRYIKNYGAGDWTPDASFMAVNTGTSIEFIENNLRFIKLKQPIRNEYSWKGNSYIDTYSSNSLLQYMDDWDYVYDSVNVPTQVGTATLDSTIKVLQADESGGEDPNDPATQYADRSYSVEKYTKGIGMVYKEFLHWEYQHPMGQTFNYTGYGITLTMTDHN